MAARERREPGGAAQRRSQPRAASSRSEQGVVPVLADAVADVEKAVQRGRVGPSIRSRFQAVALLMREERARIQADDMSEARRTEQLKRLDRVATVLARTAPRDASLLALLAEGAAQLPETQTVLRELRRAAGLEPTPVEVPSVPVPGRAGAAR